MEWQAWHFLKTCLPAAASPPIASDIFSVCPVG
jgi:hypothetical protein